MKHSFYTPNVELGKSITLDRIESNHLAKVLRLKEGEAVMLLDGAGSLFEGEITSADPKRSIVDCLRLFKFCKARPDFTIAVSLTKTAARFEWFLEKATELGVGKIIPVVFKRTARSKANKERMQKILISAMKQCDIPFLPVLEPIHKFSDLLKASSAYDHRYIACVSDGTHLMQQLPQNGSKIVLIGPEGDFTDEEVQEAMNHGFQKVSLGENRLRVETAAIAATHIFSISER